MTEHRSFAIHDDIHHAETLPAWVYSDPDVYARAREAVFVPSWQLVTDSGRVKAPNQVVPATLLEGMLDEPVLVTRSPDDQVRCLSNVCTHRGHRVAESEGVVSVLRCRYHGRRFALDGRFLSMPEFGGVEGFPSSRDDLPGLAMGSLEPLVFASLEPHVPFDELVAPVRARTAFLSLADAVFDFARSRDYLVHANWALYVDNYLEGFHIPYVHAALNDALDYGSYRTELFPWGSLQLGIASGSEEAFELPDDSPDRGQRVAAYYFWLWPNTMVNFYPWGLSVNVVKPLAPDRTKVSFLSYVLDPSKFDRGAGAALDRVEREDEVVVENVQRGMRSRLYHRGRYSPLRETGVHHFHRLLARVLG
jgi:choline monooxygenase